MTQKFLEKKETVVGGALVIKGTRIPAERLVALLGHGYTEENIAQEFPNLPKNKIKGAVHELSLTGLNCLE